MILLRHGQSEFNLHFSRTRVDPGIEDPGLTELGHQQAEAAAERLAGRDIRRIVVSPYTRAIQTALPASRRLGVPLTITPVVRERYAFRCDVGTPLSRLRCAFPELEFPAMDDRWWPHEEEPEHGVVSRAAAFRAEMAALEDWAHTLVVSHWGFILAFTGRSAANGEILETDPRLPAPARLVWKP